MSRQISSIQMIPVGMRITPLIRGKEPDFWSAFRQSNIYGEKGNENFLTTEPWRLKPRDWAKRIEG